MEYGGGPAYDIELRPDVMPYHARAFRVVPKLDYQGSTGALRLVTIGIFYGRAVRRTTRPQF
jgi:hypothetical protein